MYTICKIFAQKKAPNSVHAWLIKMWQGTCPNVAIRKNNMKKKVHTNLQSRRGQLIDNLRWKTDDNELVSCWRTNAMCPLHNHNDSMPQLFAVRKFEDKKTKNQKQLWEETLTGWQAVHSGSGGICSTLINPYFVLLQMIHDCCNLFFLQAGIFFGM